MGDAHDGRRPGLGDWPAWGPPPPELIDPGAPARHAPPESHPRPPSPPSPPVPGAALSPLAVAAITVVGLSGMFLLLVPVLNCLGGALGLVLGVAARRHIYRAGGRLQGDNIAVGSIVTGGILVVIGLFEICVFFVLPFLLTRG